ncbi:glycoside hydrolase family 1 protein [Lacticaseibacillus absianus]|uniref:glycoside hydrolase family 1 protein n=1 Tax=Lacticaseibacillus absianus TaxID=2729623 RepID=UPI0015CE89FB|nr:glycoside hydrolase family 1 protein [Lacticaseibacillus absianus]
MANLKFPDGFWWGAATSATQSEGTVAGDGKGDNIWDYASRHYNNRFFDGVTTQETSRFYTDHVADIDRMKALGLNSLRTSISWSRLIPDASGTVNPLAVQFYRDVFQRMRDAGIAPFVNLFHFDLPMYLQTEGGWENKATIDAYARYAKTCFELFGDLVDHWFTFNEPMIPAEAGYLHDRHYPFVVEFKRAAQVLHNIVVAHCRGIEAFRASGLTSQIGIIMDVIPVYPRSQNPADLKAAHMADLFYTKSLNEAILKGHYPSELNEVLTQYGQRPEAVSAEELALIAATKIDLLGINYYRPRRVKARESLPNPEGVFAPEWFFEPYEMPGRQMNTSRGIEIYPEALYDIAKMIDRDYPGIPWFVSENGIGIQDEARFIRDGMVQDDYRIDFLKAHLACLHRAISEGSHCLGYHMWTFVDCWSWMNAYKNRYGFYRLDLATGEKTLKKSGVWFKQLIQANGFELTQTE